LTKKGICLSNSVLKTGACWSMQKFAAWNTAACLRLSNNNTTWIWDLALGIPEASWNINITNDPILHARHPSIDKIF